VRELLAHLEVQALGNLDPHVHFAVLSDFPDAPTETLPGDADILDAAREGIAELNAKHPDATTGRFFLFHRLRQWNEREGLWMGWERKRGKIEEFNRLLRGATIRALSCRLAISRFCRRSSTASRSTVTRGCHEVWRVS
jgi:cyclic beta-1,2-glucan synthetase